MCLQAALGTSDALGPLDDNDADMAGEEEEEDEEAEEAEGVVVADNQLEDDLSAALAKSVKL